MAELNPHNILTLDLLLAIGIEITEYMLLFYNETPMWTSALQGNVYLQEVYFSANL
ncbi:hypothetical protein BDZ91DRAFT_715029 [Kalaharituber pfeilii]|nr:hypothetical protein BDZ91DRAFT_715029 [Kalaharituber pfeilii]